MTGWQTCRRRRYRVHDADGEIRPPAAPTGRRSRYPTLTAATNIGASHRRALACDGCVFSASAAWVLIARQKLVRPPGPRSSAALLRRRLCILARWGLLGLTAGLQRLSRRWKAAQTTDGLTRGRAARKHHAGPGHLAPAPHRLIAASACTPPNGTPSCFRSQCPNDLRSVARFVWYNPA